ncbi:MAG: lysophospholipid acyltransferase family protein [Steroidobacteraceae bacterium]
MNNPLGAVLRMIYGCYVWLCASLLGTGTLLLLLVLPGMVRRRVLAKSAARLLLRLVGIRYELRDAALLPTTACVVVANHSSYLDGVLMKAALPANFSFVIKKEMVRIPLAGLLLRRIGSLFVDRVNRHAGGMDTRRILRDALAGQSLVFFPEGTFTQKVGLQAFHLGAFVIAQRTQLPVVPIAIHGARRILRPGSPWPRPGKAIVEVLSELPTNTEQKNRSQTEALRDHARARILIALGDPDLLTDIGEGNSDQTHVH